jgi:hypothetical protein
LLPRWAGEMEKAEGLTMIVSFISTPNALARGQNEWTRNQFLKQEITEEQSLDFVDN